MAWPGYDRVIVAGTGLWIAGLAVALHFYLKQWTDEAEVKPPQPKTQYITQDTEDSLKTKTLDTLLGHYNYAIRDTASKIVCDRAVNDELTVETLLRGITRPDYDERMKNLRALAIITDPQSLPLLNNEKACAALVRSLELSLDPEQETLNHEYWDEYAMRDMTEKLCLMFISQLMNRYGPENIVKAKFVEKWLAKQNWGASKEERLRNFNHHIARRRNRIADIAGRIKNYPSGKDALDKVGLYSDDADEDLGQEVGSGTQFNMILPVNLDSLAEDDPARILLQSLQTVDEQRTRNRNREAMVLNDGSRPFNSDDIIQPNLGSPLG
ncbi:hypothetical protein B0T26DRAFT_631302 [Lasiosphaeria miniovina]|uniref:Cytoskeleton-associated protein n=1 Tax=Lasiosphaeria miniovina TaxID=1954250 RepID=A0AA40EB31_9PEZI|nr:uncharacterized protein B0T26DRAFT_631302 [Lasiosphaeria miniovina]KAK0733430.1 hypothetical protein B0T26DRAFT_631302 [Lasiosphaeria miniovina]